MNIKKNDLLPHWLVLGVMLLLLMTYVVVCQQLGHELREPLPEKQRIIIRTIFYVLAIVLLPMTNLIRHIQLRLNQTMPGNKSAKSRYFLTIMVSMVLIEGVGVLGFVMYLFGDDFNTLYIFNGLAALGLYLYRPKPEEYQSIVDALTEAEAVSK